MKKESENAPNQLYGNSEITRSTMRFAVVGLVLCIGTLASSSARAYAVAIDGQAGPIGRPDVGQGFRDVQVNGATSLSNSVSAVLDGLDPRLSFSDEASASVSLNTGLIRLYAHGDRPKPDPNNPVEGLSTAIADAGFSDTVTFLMPDSQTSALVDFVFHVSGVVSVRAEPDGDTAEANAERFDILNLNSGSFAFNYSATAHNQGPDCNPKNGAEPICGLGAKDFTLIASIEVEPGVQYRIDAALSGIVRGAGTVDFSHTGALSIELPTGVTFRSESGVLLTQPIPLPGAVWLFASALGALGATRCRVS